MQNVILIQSDQEGAKTKCDCIQEEYHAIKEATSEPKNVTSPQRFPVHTIQTSKLSLANMQTAVCK